MAMEIEAKMKVNDLKSVATRLEELRAERKERVLETNIFFDTDDRRLLASDQGLRLRVARDETSGSEKYVLTHKGPQQRGPLKSREESELEVTDAPSAVKLFECLGFSRKMSFQKRRQSWELGGCSVVLDEVPHLGAFVEIEGPAEADVMRVREQLKLADRPLIKASYIAMITSYLQERGDRTTDVEFAR